MHIVLKIDGIGLMTKQVNIFLIIKKKTNTTKSPPPHLPPFLPPQFWNITKVFTEGDVSLAYNIFLESCLIDVAHSTWLTLLLLSVVSITMQFWASVSYQHYNCSVLPYCLHQLVCYNTSDLLSFQLFQPYSFPLSVLIPSLLPLSMMSLQGWCILGQEYSKL